MSVAPWWWCSRSYKFAERSLLRQILACPPCCLGCPCFMALDVYQPFFYDDCFGPAFWKYLDEVSQDHRSVYSRVAFFFAWSQQRLLVNSFTSVVVNFICNFQITAGTFDFPLMLSNAPGFSHLLGWRFMNFKLTRSTLIKKNFHLQDCPRVGIWYH